MGTDFKGFGQPASLIACNKAQCSLLNSVMRMQIPLLPVFCHLHVHPASCLSKMLPPAADRYMRNSYVQEVTLKHLFLITIGVHICSSVAFCAADSCAFQL